MVSTRFARSCDTHHVSGGAGIMNEEEILRRIKDLEDKTELILCMIAEMRSERMPIVNVKKGTLKRLDPDILE